MVLQWACRGHQLSLECRAAIALPSPPFSSSLKAVSWLRFGWDGSSLATLASLCGQLLQALVKQKRDRETEWIKGGNKCILINCPYKGQNPHCGFFFSFHFSFSLCSASLQGGSESSVAKASQKHTAYANPTIHPAQSGLSPCFSLPLYLSRPPCSGRGL